MAMIIRPLIIAVADPGDGSGDPAPPYFQTILMPDGRKKFFGDRSPFSQGLDDRRPLPPPRPSQALDPALY